MLRNTKRYIHTLGSRHFSTINIVKRGILHYCNTDTVTSKQKKKLLKHGIDVNEEMESDSIDAMQYETKYFVGDLTPDPNVIHSNMSKFQKSYLRNLTPRNNWETDKNTKQLLGIPITSTINYHPFPITFPKETKKSTKNTKKSFWKQVTNVNYNHFVDSIGDDLPLLNRKINKKINQELLMFRDSHPDIKNIARIEKLVREYKPDIIVLEAGGGGDHLFAYVSLWRRISSMLLKIRQKLVSNKNSEKIGSRWYWGKLGFTVTDSFAIDKAIAIAINTHIPIVLSDYPQGTADVLMEGAKLLDCYSHGFLEVVEFPIKKFIKLSNQSLLPNSFQHYASTLVHPHLNMVSSYRNDAMSLTLNECMEERVLFISGAFHTQDIIGRLCGKVAITNPFKSIDERRVDLKHQIPHNYSGASKVFVSDDEVATTNKLLGEKAVKLIFLSNEQRMQKLLEKLTHKLLEKQINEIKQKLKTESKVE